jgi:hypothetical protein
MKLDRNINGNGRGKYALLKLRKLDEFAEPDDPFQKVAPAIVKAMAVLEGAGILDWGIAGTEAEFMVIRLKDKYASEALEAYAAAAIADDPEYAGEVRDMADRAGPNSPWCKTPD